MYSARAVTLVILDTFIVHVTYLFRYEGDGFRTRGDVCRRCPRNHSRLQYGQPHGLFVRHEPWRQRPGAGRARPRRAGRVRRRRLAMGRLQRQRQLRRLVHDDVRRRRGEEHDRSSAGLPRRP